MRARETAGTGPRGRPWARPGLATIVVGLGCVGLPPPPPSELATSTTGEATLATTVGSASTTGLAETTELGGSETAPGTGSSTTAAGGCIDVECTPGEACVDGECVACPIPRCDACPSGSCECPAEEPCCDVGTCVLPSCNPFAQDCMMGEGCYFVGDAWACAPDASGDVGGYGSSCENINVCDPGLVCVDAGAVPGCMGMLGCCSPICDVLDPAGSAQCPGGADGQVCVALYEPGTAPPGLENVGVCAVPPMM